MRNVRSCTATRVYVVIEHADLYACTLTHNTDTAAIRTATGGVSASVRITAFDYNVYARRCAATRVHVRIRISVSAALDRRYMYICKNVLENGRG